jgi:hypothetical protein
MDPRAKIRKFIDGRRAKPKAAASATGDSASTPYQQLLHAADRGQFEAVVRAARLAEPIAMVTPEEREAELLATGHWPADKAEPAPAPPPAPEPPRELTPSEQYIAETCRWSERRPPPVRVRRPGRCLVAYNVLTGELIGDGYGDYEKDRR